MKTRPEYCPMIKEVGLTKPQMEHFCALGCSKKCPELLEKFKVAVEKEAKRKVNEAVLMKVSTERRYDR